MKIQARWKGKTHFVKKAGTLAVASALLLLVPGAVEIVQGNSKFEGNEDYWRNYCSQPFSSAADAQECYEFQSYLSQKSSSLNSLNKEIDNKIAALQSDLSVIEQEALSLQEELDGLDAEIASLESDIAALEAQVSALETQIQENTEAIKKKDDDIKARMVNSQSFVNTNGYIDFIMGATDFTDLLERISIMDQITTYENEQIESLNEDIKKLDNDKKEVERQQELVDLQKADIEVKREEIAAKKRYQDKLIEEGHRKEADLYNQILQNEEEMNKIIASIPKITIDDGTLPPSSNGWGRVVSGYRSAGTWAYDDGGFHPGLDIAGAVGSPITAPINGVIGYTRDGYPTYGHLGNAAGYANMIVMVGEVNGRTYGVLVGHLMLNGIAVTPGQIVSQGQTIGYRGSSGNSTGPHTHIEVYDLGTVGINGGLQILQSRGYNFGVYYNASSQCEYKAPVCRLRPEYYVVY